MQAKGPGAQGPKPTGSLGQLEIGQDLPRSEHFFIQYKVGFSQHSDSPTNVLSLSQTA